MGFLENRTKGNIIYKLLGTGEMAQGLKALAALPKDRSSVPSIHMKWLTSSASDNLLPFSGLSGYLYTSGLHTHK